MKRTVFEKIVSFLLGISWMFIILGSYITFKLFIFLGVATALFIAVLYIVFGLFFILLLETMLTYRARLDESKKQTQLLQEIRNALVK